MQPTRADKTKPVTRSGDDHREPRETGRRDSLRGDEARIEGNRHRRSAALDRDPDQTESNPAAGRAQVQRSGSTARSLTDGAPRFGSADAAEHHAQAEAADGADPATPTPDPMEPGTEIPPVPDLAGRTPTGPVQENPLIGTQETFEVEGVQYERTTAPNGEVRVSYEVDGVEYSNTTQEDGRNSVLATQSDDDGLHSRTVQRDAQGNLIDDTSETTQGQTDPETGEFRSSTRTERLVPDGTRTTTSVERVDGEPRSYTSQITDPEGHVRNARLDLPENLDPERFTEQLANFAANGDPTLLATAVSSVGRERLRDVVGSTYGAEDQTGFYNLLQATQAASAAGGPGATDAFAGALHDTITDERFIENSLDTPGMATLQQAVYDFAAQGGDASLGTELLDRLLTTSEGDSMAASLASVALQGPGVSDNGLISNLVDGLSAHSNEFGQAADRVDQLNQDLSYLTLNYAPFMTDTQLAAAQEEFRQTHADEYAAYENQSAGIVTNVDNMQRLEDLMSSHGDELVDPFASTRDNFQQLNDQELKRVRQASGTQQGRAELTTELQNAGRGRPSFLQDLGRMAGDNDDDRRQLDILRGNLLDTAVSSSAGSASVGDSQGARDVLEGLGISDPGIPGEAISALEELSNGGADLNEVRLDRLDDALDGAEIDSALSGRLRNAGAILGLAGLAADGIEILSGDATAETYIGALSDGTGLATSVFEEALSRTFSAAGVQTVGRVAGGVGVILSAVGAVQSLAEGDVAGAGLNLAAAVGGALTLSSSAAVTGVGAVITVAAIAGQVGLAQYRNVEASNHFESADTERFVGHALSGANLSESQEDAILHELRNADNHGRLTGVLFAQAAQQAGVSPSDFLTQIARLGPDAVHDIVTTGHGVDPGDDGPTDLNPEEVADFLEFVRNEYGVAA